MKKIVINLISAVGIVFCIGSTPVMATPRPALINPGTDLPPAANNTPQTGIAYTPVHTGGKQKPTAKQAVAQASLSGLSYLVRCPAADPNNPNCQDLRQWKPLESSTAYYHDPIIAAVTTIIDATDGETWSVSFTQPSGGRINISPVSFSSNGNCFNMGSYTVCGTRSINIYWYFNSQCTETGDWRVEAMHNGGPLGTLDFSVRPQLGTPAEVAAKLPPYSQTDYAHEVYANTCHDPGMDNHYNCSLNKPGQIPWTIAELGCTITSYSSMLTYFGAPVSPPTLNQWLLDNDMYELDGRIKRTAVNKYARSRNVNVSRIGEGDGDPVSLNRNICFYGPVPIRADNHTHTVTAIGRDDALTTVSILDPDGGVTTELTEARFNNQFDKQMIFSGPEHRYSDQSGLTFTFHSPVEAFVVDPLGRRQGIDPRTGAAYNEIPRASYSLDSQFGPVVLSDYEPPKVLDIIQPAEGVYTLNVVGTGVGTYNADFEAYDIDLNTTEISVADIPTAPNLVNTYEINFSKAVGSKIQVGGGFDGGGQRPKDVNRFLSYANPGASRTFLPAGTTSYPLLFFYGATVIPSSFTAKLNGADITALFHPAQGIGEKVLLNLQQGRNVLVLSVDGDLGRRVATDSDRLIFDVQ